MKKRYQVTLTEDAVNRFQKLVEKLNMPRSSMSSMLDDALKGCVTNMEKWVKQGKVSMVDLFAMVGEQIDQINEEEKANDAKAANQSKAPAKTRKKT